MWPGSVTACPWPGSVTECVCTGTLLLPSVTLSLPPVFPAAESPRRNLPTRFGRLNVLLPSPLPHTVPIAANNSAKLVRLTAAPSHTSHPPGAVNPPHIAMNPTLVGAVVPPVRSHNDSRN